VLANDLSANGQPLAAVLATGPSHGALKLNADGSFVYTPAANFVGADSFTYQARGSDGSLSAVAVVTVQVSYRFSGFLPPLGKGLSFGLNRTIPVKFQLSDAKGSAISSLSAVTSLQVAPVVNGVAGTPFTPASSDGKGLQYTGGQYQFNWQTKGLAAGTYQIQLTLADGTVQTRTIQLTVNGNGANAQAADGRDVSAGGTAGQLLGGDLEVYVDNGNGDLTSDELARIQDAVTAVDAVTMPYGVTVEETADPTQATVTVGMASTSAVGGQANGILGCFDPAAAQITLVQGWDWYGGSDPTEVGATQYDFETTLTHELGHALGLGESADPTSAMYGTLAPGTAIRTLTAADLNVPYDEAGADAQRAAPPAPSGQVQLSATVIGTPGSSPRMLPTAGAAPVVVPPVGALAEAAGVPVVSAGPIGVTPPVPPGSQPPAGTTTAILAVAAGSPWQAAGARVPAFDSPGESPWALFPDPALPADPEQPAEAPLPDRGAAAQDEPSPAAPDAGASLSAGSRGVDGWFSVLGDGRDAEGWGLPAAAAGSTADLEAEVFQAAVQAVFADQEE
jgi:hypothetical protein